MAFGFGFGMPRSFATPFSPASLFATGAPGAWYDPSDINLNWRYNLLTYTEQFDNAVWVKSGTTVTANFGIAPDGTATADRALTVATGNALKATYQSFSAEAGTYRFNLYVKDNASSSRVFEVFFANTSLSATTGTSYNFDTDSLTNLSNAAPFTLVSSNRTSSGNGWYLISITVAVASAQTVRLYFSAPYAGTQSGDYLVWGASLTTAANASLPYQQIVTPEISYLNYQPQPILYQDSAGTTPVTAVEQPVGLMLDKSQGLVLGSDLAGAIQWGGPSGTVVGGVIDSPLTFGSPYYVIPTVAGKTYRVKTVFSACSGGGGVLLRAWDGNAAFGTVLASFGAVTSPVAAEFVFLATSSFATIYYQKQTNTTNAFAATVPTVRELPGNHAFQSTAASRPVLSARYNLLTKTDSLGPANGWATGYTGAWTGTYTSAPDGTQTGMSIKNVSVSSNQYFYGLSVSTGTYRMSVCAKVNTGSRISVFEYFTNNNSRVVFDLIGTGSIFSNPSGYAAGISPHPDGNGWYYCYVDLPVSAGAREFDFVPTVLNSEVYFWGASIVPTNQSTLPYQRVNTATDYNTVGYNPYLKFDGVDDSLSTNSINFTSTDKMSVFAGVRKLSDAADGVLTELSATVSTNDGSFAVLAPYSSTTNRLGFALRGSSARTNQITGSSPYEAPTTLVLAVRYNTAETTSATEILPRVNGVVPSTSTAGAADSGTGNFGNYPLYIGRRGGSSVPFNGQLYSMIIVGKAVTAGELSSTETYVNQKTGAY